MNGINVDLSKEREPLVEPLVVFMGMGATRSSWRYQTETFRRYFRTVTFDNRGVGKSDKPAGPYSIKMMADETLGLMDHLGIERAHVLGVSLGGMIAQELAASHPERVDRVVLGCTFAKAGPTPTFQR